MNRRSFLRSAGLAVVGAGLAGRSPAAALRTRELRITRILVKDAPGRRLTPVAPNAYAAYRGYDVTERILRIQTAQGLEGIGRATTPARLLPALVGHDPFKLFAWEAGDRIAGPAEEHRELLASLGGADVALLDLLGRALERPTSRLLGAAVRDSIPVYDSSLYMEDLLAPDQLQGVAYLRGPRPADPAELVARKAEWVMRDRAEGFNAVKVKIGRVKWMESFEAALARDIAVTHAVRRAIGPRARLTVDGNKGYQARPLAAAEYAAGVAGADVYFMEEMFAETDVAATRELKARLRAAKNPVKLAAGESFPGGVPESVYTERFVGAGGSEPLIDIEQADMNANGFLRLRSKAGVQRPLGMTLAPHNFGSKIGFFAQVHLGLTVPNWEIAEMDDSEFPALLPEGIAVRGGMASLTGAPGLGVRLREDALGRTTFETSP